MLKDVHLGDEYGIEIVPSSALGNGSATVTTISELYNDPTKYLFQGEQNRLICPKQDRVLAIQIRGLGRNSE